MSKNTTSNSGGIGVLGLLGVAFVVLKLTGYIDWSWWWVTAPFWAGFVLLFLVLLVVAITQVIMERRKDQQEANGSADK